MHGLKKTSNLLIVSFFLASGCSQMHATLPIDPSQNVWEANKYGDLYSRKKEYAKALKYYKAALKLNWASHRERNPYVATDLFNIAQTLDALGNHDEAQKYYNRALAIREKFDSSGYKPSLAKITEGKRDLSAKIIAVVETP